MIESWKQSGLFAIAIVIAIAIAVGLQAWSLASANVVAINVWQSGGPKPQIFFSEPVALAYASSLAGFTLTAPTYLPPGYALAGIDVGELDTIKRSVCLGIVTPGGPRPLAPGHSCFASRDHLVVILTIPSNLIHDDHPAIASLPAGAAVLKWSVNAYELVTQTRTIGLEAYGSSLGDAEAVAILSSIPIPRDIPR